MDLKAALRGQYHGGMAMLRQSVERCPEEVWVSGEHPRNYWRIAFHAVFYTHLYLERDVDAFQKWDKDREGCACLWETPPVLEPYARTEMLEYIDQTIASIDSKVEVLDLESTTTGFPWYSKITKLDHQLMNLRHLQGHVGQLSEILMAHGVDTDWISIAS